MIDPFGWKDRRFRHRESYGPDAGPHLTGTDWSQSRKPTAIDPRYRWVEPSRENRRKEDWPYSYTDHYLWGRKQNGDSAVYSDRLHQWSSEAWDRAWKAVGSKRFDQFTDADANKFMSAYYEKPIKVTALAEGCNVGNGYPYWILWFRDEDRALSQEQQSAGGRS